MSKLKEKLNIFKEEFSRGYVVSRDRYLMARERNYSYRDLTKWCELEDNLSFKKGMGDATGLFAGLFGVVAGYMTTFCPFHCLVSAFNKEAEEIRTILHSNQASR